jgi:hypothetical protein
MFDTKDKPSGMEQMALNFLSRAMGVTPEDLQKTATDIQGTFRNAKDSALRMEANTQAILRNQKAIMDRLEIGGQYDHGNSNDGNTGTPG